MSLYLLISSCDHIHENKQRIRERAQHTNKHCAALRMIDEETQNDVHAFSHRHLLQQRLHSLGHGDLLRCFPQLYLPTDLIACYVDDASTNRLAVVYAADKDTITTDTRTDEEKPLNDAPRGHVQVVASDVLWRLEHSVPVVYETTPALLLPSSTDEAPITTTTPTPATGDTNGSESQEVEKKTTEGKNKELVVVPIEQWVSDSLEPPVYTCLPLPVTAYLPHLSPSCTLLPSSSSWQLLPPSPSPASASLPHGLRTLPVKFNVRVLITLGFRDAETDRVTTVDHHIARKLRVLVGRKKGCLMLLGGSWQAELDGGDPSGTDTCNTQRPTVLVLI